MSQALCLRKPQLVIPLVGTTNLRLATDLSQVADRQLPSVPIIQRRSRDPQPV